MSESLPPRPNLHWLKNRAKERLATLRAADPAVKLADGLRSVAKDYGYSSWRQLKAAVEAKQAEPAFGRLGFVVFPVADLARSRVFYESILGAPVLAASSSTVDFSFAGIRLRIYIHTGEYSRQHSGLQILVPGLDAMVETWKSRGVMFRSDIRTEPWGGRVITVADPDGNLFDAVDDAYADKLDEADVPEAMADPEAEKRITARFREAVTRGDATVLKQLLADEPVARALVNTPMFSFDSRPITEARGHRDVIDLLLDHGADINLKSTWWAGGFGVLELADTQTAEFLISRGAVVDIWAASHLDKLDRARELLDADPTVIHAKGGDGGRPLHFATTAAMVDLLLERGADLEARDVDHESTAAQWAMPRPGDSLDLLRHFARRGAVADVFMAAALNDVPRLTAILEADPALVGAQSGERGIPLCPKAPGEHMYIYKFGRGRTPEEVATLFGATDAVRLLQSRGTAELKFLSAIAAADRLAVDGWLKNDPDFVRRLSVHDQGRLPRAAWDGHLDAVRLMLDIGFDPAVIGADTGTALHCAAWHGRAVMVEMILNHPAVRDRLPELLAIKEPTFSATPLDWCCHGSTHGRAPGGDYGAVARMLAAAGAVPGKNLADASAAVRAVLA